jgi:dTDP-4-amino-4,6-dideoxygalactose transaminase
MKFRIIPRTAIPIDYNILKILFQRANLNDISSFEYNLEKYMGAKAVFALASGRSALALALRLFKLRPGKKILFPAFVCPVVYDVVVSMGFKPVPVDVSLETYNIDIAHIKKIQVEDSCLIIPVHLFGKACNIDEIIEFAERHGLYVIEDVAQALGVEFKGKKLGSFGDMAIQSFGLGKNITGGGGGALIINHDDFIGDAKNIIDSLFNPKFQDRVTVTENVVGMKFITNPYRYLTIRKYVDSNLNRLDVEMIRHIKASLIKPDSDKYRPIKIHPLSAKIANYQLEKMEEFNRRRIQNARIISDILQKQSIVSVPSEEYFKNNVFCRYPLKILEDYSFGRDSIVQKLLNIGVDSEKPYFVLKELLSEFENVFNSKRLVDSLITIPNHPSLSDNEATLVGEVTLSVLKSYY